MSSYGYLGMYKPPKPPRLAQAASGRDPYGLQASVSRQVSALGLGAGHGFAAPTQVSEHGRGGGYSPPTAYAKPVQEHNVFNPVATAAPTPTPTAAAVNSYDLNTDPALQQIQSLVGMSNEQANASALKQRQNLLLAYGDQALAEAVLGSGDPIALAAGKNPTSTVKQLGQARDRNIKSLDDQLNAGNLSYSGYRVTQDEQAGQDYQNALATAAGGLNSNLDQVGSNLAAALAGNNQQIVQGINDAANRAQQNALQGGGDPGAPSPSASASGAGLSGGGLPVGSTLNDAIYQLLGRKNDPRYQGI